MLGFRILQVSSTQLVIQDPPPYLFAAFFIVVAMVGLFMLGGSLIARAQPHAAPVQFEGKKYSQRDLARERWVPVMGLLLLLGAGHGAGENKASVRLQGIPSLQMPTYHQ